jgi:uncharacterized protein (TIGR03437 family)
MGVNYNLRIVPRGFLFVLGALFAVSAAAQNASVGSGAPDIFIASGFVQAYQRNGFSALVGSPTADVTKFGSAGLIQQFPSVSNSALTLALIKPDTTDNPNVQQVLAAMFAYYSTVTVATAGFPTTDTLNCPSLHSTVTSCQWQPFSSNYALFVYSSPLGGGAQNFATNDPFYTLWTTLGGITGLGPATSAETQFTSQYNSKATAQSYDQGAIYNITSGSYSGRFLSVKEPIYDLYASLGAHSGSLGVPITAPLVLSNGMIQQNFEGGAIAYDPTKNIPVLRPAVSRITLAPLGPLQLNVGDTVAAQATLYASDGSVVTDRVAAWNTSNGRVISIAPNGLSATLTAIGAGTATVSATVDAKTSPSLSITVAASCCQIGQGSPTVSVQQAFQDAAARNHLSVQVPSPSPVTRAGNGYVQQLTGTGPSPMTYLIAVPDGSATGYVVAGALLVKYLSLGGATGALGYPTSDATAGGRQAFQQGSLAGNPVQVVTGPILAKWGGLGYETGSAGLPTDGASPFQTFRGTTGLSQPFQNATILSTGAGTAYAVARPILAQYVSSGGPSGNLGAPTDDDHVVGALRQQDFEGGYINYSPGSVAVNMVVQPRQPVITATPTSVLSGTPVHLVVGGFNSGASVRVSQTGQPDFIVGVASGAYAWDVMVPAAAPNGTITVSAADMSNSATTAQTTYIVRNTATAPLSISVVSGDGQNGAPGAQLSQPIVVLVTDQNGNAVPGQAVTFAASPGAQVVPASATTSAIGRASVILRLPLTQTVALGTAQSGHAVATFSARSSAFSLTNFPALQQGNYTALVTAAASILRYHQLRNELPQPNGLADPASLNQFLKSFCATSAQSGQFCDGYVNQTANLWRVGAFVANNVTVSVEQTDINLVRDLVAAGSPVLLSIALGSSGSAFVVATGIASNGDLMIVDPASAQNVLSGYLAQGTLAGAVRLLPQAPAQPGFLVNASGSIVVSSADGACGQMLSLPPLFFRWCEGKAGGPYELDLPPTSNGTLTDLSATGGQIKVTAASSAIVRSGAQWTLAPLGLSAATGGVLNAASFTAEVAPGGLVSIFGVGLAGANVQVNGETAPTLIATPFQINAQIPADVAPGSATLNVSSNNGNAQQAVTIKSVAPAIFPISSTQAAITNQDNTLNGPSNPALRGTGAIVIYATGFGAVTPSGILSVANTPVSAVIGGTEVPTSFAGLTPGFVGLYQANVAIPGSLPPGLTLPLYLKQGGATSNTVNVAIQ